MFGELPQQIPGIRQGMMVDLVCKSRLRVKAKFYLSASLRNASQRRVCRAQAEVPTWLSRHTASVSGCLENARSGSYAQNARRKFIFTAELAPRLAVVHIITAEQHTYSSPESLPVKGTSGGE